MTRPANPNCPHDDSPRLAQLRVVLVPPGPWIQLRPCIPPLPRMTRPPVDVRPVPWLVPPSR